MKIKNISIKNFRLLEDISVNLEDDITLIIGKNNTGKKRNTVYCKGCFGTLIVSQ